MGEVEIPTNVLQVTNISSTVTSDQIKHMLEYIGRVLDIRLFPEGYVLVLLNRNPSPTDSLSEVSRPAISVDNSQASSTTLNESMAHSHTARPDPRVETRSLMTESLAHSQELLLWRFRSKPPSCPFDS